MDDSQAESNRQFKGSFDFAFDFIWNDTNDTCDRDGTHFHGAESDEFSNERGAEPLSDSQQ